MRRTYFSRIVTGYIDGEDAVNRIQKDIPLLSDESMKVHKDKVMIHKSHLINPL